MEKEILACIDEKNIKYLHSGQISKFVYPMERQEAHRKKVSHLIIRVFIIAISPANDIHFLVQKRSKKKKEFPEYFTDSASGHVIYKKNLDINDITYNAKRELQEEFGISPNTLIQIKFYDLNAETNEKTLEIAYIFLGLVECDIELKPNPEELDVKESRFYNKSELKNILENEKYIDYSKRIWKEISELDPTKYFQLDNQKNNPIKKDIALFIGRFQPLHHGHLYVLNQLYKNHNFVKIGIGSSQLSDTKTNPFSSKERVQFLRTTLEKRSISSSKYKIYEIPDIFNAKEWVNHVKSIVGEFDIIYSNSEWVRQLFKAKGYKLGKKITIFKKKYNGSNVRELINKNNQEWKSLVPKEVANLIIQKNGIERIKQLYIETN